MSLQIAFIGYGEVGQLFSRELLAKPGVRIAAYDILFDDPERGPGLSAAHPRTVSRRPAAPPRRAVAPIS